MPIPKWMQEDMGFSDTEVAALDPLFTTDRLSKLEAGHLRQADYSKKMNELQKSQTDLATANDRLTTEMAEWATVQASGRTVTEKMQRDLETAQANVARLHARVQKVAIDAGLDPAKALEGLDQAPPPPPPPTPGPDMSNYIDREAAGRLANMALTLPAELAAAQHEHHELTGQWLDGREIVREIQTRATTPGNKKSLEVRDVWEELHKIPDLRATKSKEKYDADIAAAVERGKQEALTSLSIPGAGAPPTHGRPSPILHTVDNKPRESQLKRPQPGTGSQSAIAALRSGKYRQPGQPGQPGQSGKTG